MSNMHNEDNVLTIEISGKYQFYCNTYWTFNEGRWSNINKYEFVENTIKLYDYNYLIKQLNKEQKEKQKEEIELILLEKEDEIKGVLNYLKDVLERYIKENKIRI